ncbi:MAG: SxtJ family membrane protein [Planctomycetota bacterium]
MSTLSQDPKSTADLRKFGFVMTGGFLLIGGFVAWLGGGIGTATKVLWGIAAAFMIMALVAPAILRPIEKYWMLLAGVLGWFNTRLILSVMFYLVFTPIALFMKLIGRDALDRKMEKSESYWRTIPEEETFEPKSFERQF